MRVLAAVDKFRGTATAAEAARAIAAACQTLGIDCVEMPLADGGEGTLQVLGGPNRTSQVEGPLGLPATAQWRLHDDTAVIEMAQASGLQLVGGAAGNDAVLASTVGTGQLINEALALGARRIIVGVGGSATTDGGLGAVQAITQPDRLRDVDFVVACDVHTMFVDAAATFAPQKGASAQQVQFLTARLNGAADHYFARFGVEVRVVPGGGAAGGLAGGLAALGARLVPGFDLVANEVGFPAALADCDLVITGEGRLDATSFTGKVVGEVARYAAERRAMLHDATTPGAAPLYLPATALCGALDPSAREPAAQLELHTVSLVEQFGNDAFANTTECITRATRAVLEAYS
ncbi:MAG: glycerate kinase [Actinobacteria bacterium]|nr:glycerate kinase [Actinomycetota bacterium]